MYRGLNKMSEEDSQESEMEELKNLIKEGRIDDSVKFISTYLEHISEDDYIEKLENVLEVVLGIHGGRTVVRFLIEQEIIDIPSLLENLSKRDSLLRYSFLLLLKDICENEGDLILPYSEDLLNSEDPNVREANLQLLYFMAGGDKISQDQEDLIKVIASKLDDEKDFVAEKAAQVLKAIGKNSPSLVAKILGDYIKEVHENEELKKRIDNIVKAIVTIEKIEEIVEEEETKLEDLEETDIEKEQDSKELEKIKEEIIDKKLELKKKEIEINKKKLEQEEKALKEKMDSLEIKKDIIKTEKEEIISPKLEKIDEEIQKEEAIIHDKELELKKKDLQIKKKQLELEEKEKELETIAIKEKEKALRIKEQLMKKEKELNRVELELKQKEIQEKQKELLDKESERIEQKMKKIEKDEENNS